MDAADDVTEEASAGNGQHEETQDLWTEATNEFADLR